MTRLTRTKPFGLAVFAYLALAANADAQPSKEARAASLQLFDEARKLAQAGKYAEACPKFEEAEKIDPGMGTEFNLADCYEHQGRFASAWVEFREVVAKAIAAGQPDREREAKRRAAAIEPKIARVRIAVPPDAPGDLEVKRDGTAISRALWGTGIPVDPGKHVISASASGKETWEGTITVDAPGTTQAIEVPPLKDKPASAATPSAVPVTPATVEPIPTSTPPAEPPSRPWQTPLGIACVGVGVAGVAVGAVMAFQAKSKNDQSKADNHCAGNQCDSTGTGLRNDARTFGNVATVGFIAGGALAAVGVALVLTAPHKKRAAGLAPTLHTHADESAGVRVGAAPNGVWMSGAW
jgi:hypothetical protein